VAETDLIDSAQWLAQAASDLRAAKAIQRAQDAILPEDVGCHLAALCAQALEKSIKGYFILCGKTPGHSHRADKYLEVLLREGTARYRDHFRKVSALFDAETKGVVRSLISLTPGASRDKNGPNTEYPWGEPGSLSAPVESPVFHQVKDHDTWISTAERVVNSLSKLRISAGRLP